MTIEHDTVVDLLEYWASSQPEHRVLLFLHPNGAADEISYARLREDACRIALRLRSIGVEPGNLVLLAFEHGYTVVATFLGAIYAGAIPSILPYIPADKIPVAYPARIKRQVEQTGTSAIVTAAGVAAQLRELFAESECYVIEIDLDAIEPAPAFVPPHATPNDIAYIQFSSGSTGLPKGITLSHRAIIDHLTALQRAEIVLPTDVVVGWLPLFHDMGFIIQFLLPVAVAGKSVLMAPSHWIRRPELLFQAVHTYRGTVTWMPNFAFRHAIQHVNPNRLKGNDLSSWQFVGCGSEPIQHDSLSRFAEFFAPYGLHPDALKAGYGMAENVLVISATLRNEKPKVDSIAIDMLQKQGRALAAGVEGNPTGAVKHIVSCGRVIPGTEVIIANEAGERVGERYVGEVLIRGNALFSGYYQSPHDTAQQMVNGWFRTGDLGYLVGDELYIVDRKKDLIISGGANIYPDHIEELARAILSEQGGRAVAFGYFEPQIGTEVPVVVVEPRRIPEEEHQTLIQKIRECVVMELGVNLADVRMVTRGWIEVTTSGKIARAANREKYLASGFANQLASRSALEKPSNEQEWREVVQRHFSEHFAFGDIGLDDDFFDLGGDSLAFARLLTSLAMYTEQRLSADLLLDQPTVRHMASYLLQLEKPSTEAQGNHAMGSSRRFLQPSSKTEQKKPWYRRRPSTIPLSPYEPYMKIVGWLSRQPWFHRIVWPQRGQRLGELLAEIGSPVTPYDAMASSYQLHLGHSLHWRTIYRTKSLTGMAVAHEDEWFAMAREPGQAIILVGSHFGPVRFLRQQLSHLLKRTELAVIGHLDSPLARMEQEARSQGRVFDRMQEQLKLRTFQYYAALQRLKEGGVVVFAADGGQGTQFVNARFLGRQKKLGIGFAQLAWETEALAVPYFVLQRDDGKREYRFHRPLSASRHEHDTFVTNMIEQYADLLGEYWRAHPGNMRWYLVEQYFNLPIAGTEMESLGTDAG